MTTLKLKDLNVQINAGELVSLIKNKHEYIHQKGSPGWNHSDIEMFPIIGPTDDVQFKVKTPQKDAILDQHGLLRELDYELVEADDAHALFQKKYKAGTQVKNSKYNAHEKSTSDSAKDLFRNKVTEL